MSAKTTMTQFPPGKHLIIDFWGAENLTDIKVIDKALRNAASACGATILNIDLHEFGEGCGVTGVAVLAESHISIHTWPEDAYAALDIFMCGACDPNNAIEPLKEIFNPEKVKITELIRGVDE